jgi:hypothetical protein
MGHFWVELNKGDVSGWPSSGRVIHCGSLSGSKHFDDPDFPRLWGSALQICPVCDGRDNEAQF